MEKESNFVNKANELPDGEIRAVYFDKSGVNDEAFDENDSNDPIDFQDNYAHIDPAVFYTTQNIPGPGIDEDLFYSQISHSCQCREFEHVDNQHALEFSQIGWSTQPSSTSSGQERILSSSNSEAKVNTETSNLTVMEQQNFDNQVTQYLCKDNCSCNLTRNYTNNKLNFDSYKLPMHECNNLCKCSSYRKCDVGSSSNPSTGRLSECSNRVVQKGPHDALAVFEHEVSGKGFGVKSTRSIARGEFICEYAGEVIGKCEAKRRYNQYKLENQQRLNENCHFYIFHLSEIALRNVGCKSELKYKEKQTVERVSQSKNKEISRNRTIGSFDRTKEGGQTPTNPATKTLVTTEEISQNRPIVSYDGTKEGQTPTNPATKTLVTTKAGSNHTDSDVIIHANKNSKIIGNEVNLKSKLIPNELELEEFAGNPESRVSSPKNQSSRPCENSNRNSQMRDLDKFRERGNSNTRSFNTTSSKISNCGKITFSATPTSSDCSIIMSCPSALGDGNESVIDCMLSGSSMNMCRSEVMVDSALVESIKYNTRFKKAYPVSNDSGSGPVFSDCVKITNEREVKMSKDGFLATKNDPFHNATKSMVGAPDTRIKSNFLSAKNDLSTDFTKPTFSEPTLSQSKISVGTVSESTIADSEQRLADSEQRLADSDQTIADSDQTIADSGQTIADSDQTIADSDHSYNNLTISIVSEPFESKRIITDNESSISSMKPTMPSTRSSHPAFEMFIDATVFGNIGRYINHSCDPNCAVLPVRVNSVYPSLAIFARRDIEKGEEITYDYAGLESETEPTGNDEDLRNCEKTTAGYEKQTSNDVERSTSENLTDTEGDCKDNEDLETLSETIYENESTSDEITTEISGKNEHLKAEIVTPENYESIKNKTFHGNELLKAETVNKTVTPENYEAIKDETFLKNEPNTYKNMPDSENSIRRSRNPLTLPASTTKPFREELKKCFCGQKKCRKVLPYLPLE